MISTTNISGFSSLRSVFDRATPEHHQTLARMESFIVSVADGAYSQAVSAVEQTFDEGDFHSLARMAAFKAIVEYRSGGASLPNHVSATIQHHLQDEIRRLNHSRRLFQARIIPFNAPIDPTGYDEETTLIDVFPDTATLSPSLRAELVDVFEILRAALDTLEDRIRQIFELRFLEDWPVTEIARRFGVSGSKIYELIEKGIEALQGLIPFSFRGVSSAQ